ncbi:serine hydrolase [Cellulomonas chitinilytica]|uniref:Serine hydrolase n=1 Tax=Cellulomonas chitinilytica TaxID=398759 RepID=A0A919U3Z8_9CELL|nr:serine hydrolase domain-containing protein [Cellulomonas chitinilytica]GIG22942.1 serine hydrolase [Cellulomonas chitinilytica]
MSDSTPTTTTVPTTTSSRRRRVRGATILAGLCAVGVTGALVAGPATANGRPSPGGTRDVVQTQLDALVQDVGFPGALATYQDARGRSRDYRSGVGDLATGARVPLDGQVRIGSNSKTFLAVALLQLVDEGAVDLDASVETYLPGLVHGDGVDGNAITVRQVMQHTSGVPNYTAAMDFAATRHQYVEPRELLDLALTMPGKPAGAEWSYSNTNYVIAGLIVQHVTHRPLAEVITDRVIEPLHLRDTYIPDRGEEQIRGRHPLGYHATTPGGELVEWTALDPSFAWAAGDIVSTPSDLNAFFVALLGGRLLPPALLAEMQDTVDALPEFGWKYGLGLLSTDLSCGGVAWGHGGSIPGYETGGGVGPDGRSVTVAVTALPAAMEDPEAAVRRINAAVDAVLCS